MRYFLAMLDEAVDVSSILSIVNLVLQIAFFAILGILVIAFFWGLLKGWRYAVYRLIMVAIWIAVMLFTLDPLCNFVGNFDLSSFGIPAINVAIGDITVSANVTTPYATIETLLTDLFKAMGTSLDPISLSNYVVALANNIVKLALILVYGILLLTLINFLIWFSWHLIFKWITPRKIRKDKKRKNKGRLVNAFANVLVAFVSGAMVLFPLTSLVNTINKSALRPDEETMEKIRADGGTYATVVDALDAYDSSIFAQGLFNWTYNEETGMTLDAALIDMLISSDYNGLSVSFMKELGSLASIASTALSTGVDLNGNQGEMIATLLTAKQTPEVLRLLTQNQLISTALPFAFQMAIHMDQVADFLLTDEGIDATGDDFSHTFDSLADLYDGVLASGVLEGLSVDEQGQLAFDFDYVTKILGEEGKTTFDAFFAKLDNGELALLENILDSFAFMQAVNAPTDEGEEGEETTSDQILISDFLPKASFVDENGDGRPDAVSQEFKDIKWGQEISYLFDFVYNANAIDPTFAPNLIASMTPTEEGEVDLGPVIDFAVDNIEAIGDLFVGDLSTIDQNTGHDVDPEKSCLLDSSLVQNVMPKLLTVLQGTLESSLQGTFEPGTIDLVGVADQLANENPATQMVNYKRELSALFSVLEAMVVDHPKVQELLKDFDKHPGIYIAPDNSFKGMDDDIYAGLIDALPRLDSSLIASNTLPAVFASFLEGENNPIGSLLGEEAVPFNFDVPSLGTELSKLVQAIRELDPYLSELMALGSGGINTSTIQNVLSIQIGPDETPVITYLLDLFATSAILNPAVTAEDGTTVINTNYYLLMKTVAETAFGPGTLTLTVMDFQDASRAEAESEAIGRVLESIIDTDLLSQLGDTASVEISKMLRTLDAIPEETFIELFDALGSSLIMSDCLGTYFDQTLVSGFFGEGSGISFHNVTDWAAEGKGLKSLISYASEIGDLANLDIFGSDPYAIEGILKACANSQLFVSKEDGSFLFPSFLSGLLEDNLSNSPIEYLQGTSFDKTAQDFVVDPENPYGILKDNIMALDTPELWEDEISVWGDLFTILQQMDLTTGIDIASLEVETFRSLGLTAAASKAFGNLIMPHVFIIVKDTVRSSLPAGSEEGALDNADISYVYYGTYEQVAAEVETLVDVTEAILDPTYGLIDESGNIGAIEPGSVSGKRTLEPILNGLSKSQVFNGQAEGATAYESFLIDFLFASGFYPSDFDKSEVLEIVPNVESWEAENALICQAFDNLAPVVGTGSLADFDPTSFFQGSAAEMNEKKQLLSDLLISIDNSTLLSPVLRAQVSSFSSDIQIDLVPGGLSTVNFDYQNSEGHYGEEEIERMVELLALLPNLGSDIFENAEILVEALGGLLESRVFNTVKAGEETTFFQNLIYAVLGDETISSYLYSADNPKMAGYDQKSYVDHLVYEVYFPTMVDGTDVHDVPAEMARQKDLILSLNEVFPVLSDFMGSGSFDVGSLNSEDLYQILHAVNNCDLLFDMVPNLLNGFLSSSSAIAINGVDLSLAYPFFNYYYDEDTDSMTSEADFSRRYPEAELQLIADLVGGLTEYASFFNNLNLSTISPLAVNEILVAAADSYLFNRAGPNPQTLDHTRSSIDVLPNDLTVAEQILQMFYQTAGIHRFSFEVHEDAIWLLSLTSSTGSPLISDLGTFVARDDAVEVGANNKLYDTIIASRGTDSLWQEVAILTTGTADTQGFIEIIQNTNLLGASGDMGDLSTSFMSLPPETLSTLLRALSSLSLIDVPVGYLADQVFNGETVNLQPFSMTTLTLKTDQNGELLIPAASSYGRIHSLNVALGVDQAATYSLDLYAKARTNDSYQYASGKAVTGAFELLDLDDYRPYGFDLTLLDGSNQPLAGIDVTLGVDTSDYFYREATTLADAKARYTSGGLEVLNDFLGILYDVGSGSGEGGYFSFDSNSSDGIMQALDIGIGRFLAFLGNDGGFYAAGDKESGLTGRAVLTNSLLEVASTVDLGSVAAGQNIELSLSDYVTYIPDQGRKAPLAAIESIYELLESGTSSYELEGAWFDNRIASATAISAFMKALPLMDDGSIPNPAAIQSNLFLTTLRDGGNDYRNLYETLFDIEDATSLFGYNITIGIAREILDLSVAYGNEAGTLPDRIYLLSKSMIPTHGNTTIVPHFVAGPYDLSSEYVDPLMYQDYERIKRVFKNLLEGRSFLSIAAALDPVADTAYRAAVNLFYGLGYDVVWSDDFLKATNDQSWTDLFKLQNYPSETNIFRTILDLNA